MFKNPKVPKNDLWRDILLMHSVKDERLTESPLDFGNFGILYFIFWGIFGTFNFWIMGFLNHWIFEVLVLNI